MTRIRRKESTNPNYIFHLVPSIPVSRKRPHASIDSANYSLPLFYEKNDVETNSVMDDEPLSRKPRNITCETGTMVMSVDEKLGVVSISLLV